MPRSTISDQRPSWPAVASARKALLRYSLTKAFGAAAPLASKRPVPLASTERIETCGVALLVAAAPKPATLVPCEAAGVLAASIGRFGFAGAASGARAASAARCAGAAG